MDIQYMIFLHLLVIILIGATNFFLFRFLPAIKLPTSKIHIDVKEPIYKLVQYDIEYGCGFYIAKYELEYWRDKRWFIHFIPFSQMFKFYGYGEVGRQYCTENLHNIHDLETKYTELWTYDERRLRKVKMASLNSEFIENSNKLKQS